MDGFMLCFFVKKELVGQIESKMKFLRTVRKMSQIKVDGLTINLWRYP